MQDWLLKLYIKQNNKNHGSIYYSLDRLFGNWFSSNWRNCLLITPNKIHSKSIDGAAAKIWTQGKLTANNTIQIPIFLATTNRVVANIYKSAVNIIKGSDALKQHASTCSGCPKCILNQNK